MTQPWTVHRFEQIDSTNRWLAERAAEGAPHGTVAIAGEQTAGRGRLGRTWTAPPGSALLMSVLLRPSWPVEDWALLSFAVAVSARNVVRRLGVASVTVKWPNDLVALRADGSNSEGKLAGVLAQAVHGAHPGVVVGVGCNVARPVEIPAEIAQRGVWLDEIGADVTPEELSDLVLAELSSFGDTTPDAVVAALRSCCSTIGRAVRIETAAGFVEGNAVDVADDGALVVDTADGRRHFTVGDVVHLRPREN